MTMKDKMIAGLPGYADVKNDLLRRRAARTGQTPRERSGIAPTALEREILAEGARALRASRAAVGQPESIAEARDVLAAALQSDAFARFRGLVDEHRGLSDADRSLRIETITFGVTIVASVILGAQGSVGIGVPPGNWNDTSEYVIFVTVAAEEGLGEEILVGATLGLYGVQPTDLAGTSYGWSIDVGDIDDLEFQEWYRHNDKSNRLGFTITDGLGEGVEIDALESYTWIFNWEAPYVYQTPAANYMILKTITCDELSGHGPGNDEIYFTFKPDTTSKKYRYPTHGHNSMDKGDVWRAGRSIYFNEQVTVELWESDSGSSDDSLGSITYKASAFQTSATVSGDSAQYSLSAVLNPVAPPWPVTPRINGVDTAATTPGACIFNGQSYVFWKGQGNQSIYYSPSTTGRAPWPNGRPINNADTTNDAPSAIALGGQLFVFFRGTNAGLYWTASDDGVSWPLATQIPGQTTSTTPVPCVFNDTLYIFWIANDSSRRIIYSTWDASTRTWTANKSVPNTYSPYPVSPCVFNGQMYLYWTYPVFVTSGFLYGASMASNGTWSVPMLIDTGGLAAQFSPAACTYDGTIYVLFSAGANCQYVTTSDGRNYQWKGPALGTSPLYGTSLVADVFNDEVYLFLTNASQQLCFAATVP
jgi:hypothetical protein